MFGKRKASHKPQDPAAPSAPREGPPISQTPAFRTPRAAAAPLAATAPSSAPSSAPGPAPGSTSTGPEASPEPVPRRAAAAIPTPARPAAPPAQSDESDGRKLVVGRGISLSGEIKTCEKLVVEGQVQANLTDCVTLEIAQTGLFNGSARVKDAEISGCFEGELTVFGRLYLRSSGILEGTIRYADLEIERGGKIAGTVDLIDDPAALKAEQDELDAQSDDDPAEDSPIGPSVGPSGGEAAESDEVGVGPGLAAVSARQSEPAPLQGRLKIG